MLHFDHTTLAQRVLFSSGKAAENLAKEVARLDSHSVMVISGGSEHSVAQDICTEIRPVLFYDDVAPHVPMDKAEKARAAAGELGIDLIVSIGGGSTTGLAKAVALTTGVPIVAIPTTYAGSEATNVWGITESARKTTGVDDRVLPVTVIYDATLVQSLPVALSVSSGLNALAHGIDAMWAPRADPINQTMAIEAIRVLNRGLTTLVAAPQDVRGHELCLYGAYLSAVAFASAGSGLHHKICHVLGGAYNLPHAQTHAVVLPYVLAYNAPAVPQLAVRIAEAFSAATALDGLQSLRNTLDAPRALRDYGFRVSDIAEAVELIMPVIPTTNPRPVTRISLSALLHAAWSGDQPNVGNEQ